MVLAVLVVLIWGGNFVAIDAGLSRLPPLLFVAARFLLTAVPAVAFVPRPCAGWKVIVGLGLLMCVGQFGLLFVGMSMGMPAGLSSVVMQAQVLFTVLFAALILGERPRVTQLTGLAVACVGVVIIGVNRGAQVPLSALLLLIAGSACWGGANVLTRWARPTRPFSLLVYSALVAPLPLGAMSLLLEGPRRDARALRSLDWTVAWSMAFVVILATFFGFGVWYRLLSRYQTSVIAPFALLVPVTGLSSAWILLHEQPTWPQAAGSGLAVTGVALIVWSTRVTRPKPASRATIVSERRSLSGPAQALHMPAPGGFARRGRR